MGIGHIIRQLCSLFEGEVSGAGEQQQQQQCSSILCWAADSNAGCCQQQPLPQEQQQQQQQKLSTGSSRAPSLVERQLRWLQQ
jgi:hypothetical protein